MGRTVDNGRRWGRPPTALELAGLPVPDDLDGVVGVTAGASAPEVLVEDVINTLRRFGEVEVSTLPGREEHIEFRLPRELAESRDVHQTA